MPDVLRLLAVSRSGLTANELLEILEKIGYRENVKVTQFDWLVLKMCLGEHLTESSAGMFNFSHQQLREVVEYVLLRESMLCELDKNFSRHFFQIFFLPKILHFMQIFPQTICMKFQNPVLLYLL